MIWKLSQHVCRIWLQVPFWLSGCRSSGPLPWVSPAGPAWLMGPCWVRGHSREVSGETTVTQVQPHTILILRQKHQPSNPPSPTLLPFPSVPHLLQSLVRLNGCNWCPAPKHLGTGFIRGCLSPGHFFVLLSFHLSVESI